MLAVFSIGSFGATSGGGDTTVTLTDVVTITVTKGSDFAAITAADLVGATVNVTPAWTLQVDAITNYSVNAQLTNVAVSPIGTAPVGSSLLIGATQAGGTGAVASTAFSDTLSTNLSLDTAFSNVNNANGTGESSVIDLTLDLDKLGDRTAGETITYTLSFIVADTTP